MRHRFTLAIFVALLASSGAVYYLQAPAPAANPIKTPGPAAPAIAAPLPHSAKSPAAPAATKALTAAMRKRFETSPNYAAFIQDAMQRPLEGGRFYAILAYHRCDSLTGIEAKHFSMHAQSAKRDRSITVVRDLMQRCEGVKDHFPDLRAVIPRLKLDNARGVPDVLLIERGLLTQTEEKEAFHDLGRALATGDPYLIAVTLELNIDHFAALKGKGYDQAVHGSPLYIATAGAVCEITNTCENNLQLHMMCAAGGHCEHTDFRDHLRQGMTADQVRWLDTMRVELRKLAQNGR